VDRTSEPRELAAASTPEDKAFVADLVQLVKDWLAGSSIGDHPLLGAPSTDEDAGMLSADESAPSKAAAGADAAVANGVQEQLVLAPLSSFRRLLAFQELRQPQFGVQGHPGFYITKVGLLIGLRSVITP
jgi:hypothetical protein